MDELIEDEDEEEEKEEWTRETAKALFGLGIMYFNGRGFLQYYVKAYMWSNISASNGNDNGGKNRDIIAKQMTPSQIEEAQKLARECVAKNYKGC